MKDSSQPLLVVTGDVVRDWHLYGGVEAAANSLGARAAQSKPHDGGAELTRKLLAAAIQARIEASVEKAQRAVNEAADGVREGALQGTVLKAAVAELQMRRKELEAARAKAKASQWTVALGVKLPSEPPTSYGVWTPRAARKGDDKNRVWRVERHFGYGPVAGDGSTLERSKLQGKPVLTLIDDGGLAFRKGSARDAWPAFDKPGHYLLKMSGPLHHNDLWAALARTRKRLLVVVNASDLRREDAQIGRGLSWEKTAEDTLAVLRDHPFGRELCRAAHVIVTFQGEGALWVRCKGDGGIAGARLFFSPNEQEGDHARGIDGTAYGFSTCVSAGIAHALMRADALHGPKQPSPFTNARAMAAALSRGIVGGLSARRRVLELGHGPIDAAEPGFPVNALAAVLEQGGGGFESAEIPLEVLGRADCPWTILQTSERTASAEQPLVGLATLTARHGRAALSHLPALSLGAVFSVDRSETENLRTLETLMRQYEASPVQKKPLSIGIFGPPGAGKSFAVKALAQAVLGKDAPFLEFNLSQFSDPSDLIGAFHRIRDAVIAGTTPMAFWDEFDSQRYRWLQYLLAPMQDGAFQEGQITHPIGKCIFVFAGGTSDSYEEFGPAKPRENEKKGDRPEDARTLELRKEYREFKLLKGPDFLSRLHGHLNVLGPNARDAAHCPDVTWPIRRALMLRGLLGFVKDKAGDTLDADRGLLYALLKVSKYKHGARSFEKIVQALALGRSEPNGRLQRSSLPPFALLEGETVAGELFALMHERDAFINHPDLEALAAGVHDNYCEAEKKRGSLKPENDLKYADLPADAKASNREAARRIPDHLALIDFVLEPVAKDNSRSWVAPLNRAIEQHIERLAQAEHLGWCEERRASGFRYAETTDKAKKLHASLIDWSKLSAIDRERDREAIRTIPDVLGRAEYRAGRVKKVTRA